MFLHTKGVAPSHSNTKAMIGKQWTQLEKGVYSRFLAVLIKLSRSLSLLISSGLSEPCSKSQDTNFDPY